MKGKKKVPRKDASKRLAAIAAALATLAEQPKRRDELIDAWTASASSALAGGVTSASGFNPEARRVLAE